MILHPPGSPRRKKAVSGLCWLARKKCPRLKSWDVYTNINHSQPVLSHSHFHQGIYYLFVVCAKYL